uniref:Transferrin-like domain-containing protein n=1 Tax=Castor canadensis TaxID=51338 RepID=A0A8C0X2M6_CASCN
MSKIGGLPLSCIKRKSFRQCMQAIATNKADAMTLGVDLLLEAGQLPYRLRPIAAEVYGTKAQPQTQFYAVVVAKNSSSVWKKWKQVSARFLSVPLR